MDPYYQAGINESQITNLLAFPCDFPVELKSELNWRQKSLKLIELAKSGNFGNGKDESFYVVSLDDICEKYSRWISLLPNVTPFYAVKCNTDPVLLDLLAFLGTGFDCASKNEIELITNLSVPPERVVYANTCKQCSHLSFAREKGVQRMTFDCKDELEKINNLYSDAELIVRIFAEDSGAALRMSKKFGASVESAKSLVRQATELGLKVIGVSFHVGSGQTNPNAFEKPIGEAREIFDFAKNELGLKHMNVLDIGGGFPGSTNETDMRLFEKQAHVINTALKTYHFIDDTKMTVIAEPGRYFATSAFILATPIISKKSDSDNVSYYISESIHGSFKNNSYQHFVLKAPSVFYDKHAICKSSTIWGSTCDRLDKIMSNILLPNLVPGEDWLVWYDMGAYTISRSINFSGLTMGKPLVYYASEQNWSVIKNASRSNIAIINKNLLSCDQQPIEFEMSSSLFTFVNDTTLELLLSETMKYGLANSFTTTK